MGRDLVVGLDLGGTNILTMLGDDRGRVLARVEKPTGAHRGREQVLDRMEATVAAVLDQAGVDRDLVRGVGLGVPGPVDYKGGLLHHAPNLGWRDVPLGEIMSQRLGLPVHMDNDANLAALGEYRYGAGQGRAPMIYITVSTGVGGGLVLEGHIYHGATGGAGEIGHMTVVEDGPLCRCGNRGCLETMVSGTALARRAVELVHRGRGAGILAASRGSREEITARVVARAAGAGDPEALELFREVGYYLGLALAGLVNVLNPGVVVLGGGMMKSRELFWQPMLEQVEQRSFSSSFEAVHIVPATLGNESGARGAVALALERIGLY